MTTAIHIQVIVLVICFVFFLFCSTKALKVEERKVTIVKIVKTTIVTNGNRNRNTMSKNILVRGREGKGRVSHDDDLD